MGMLLDAITCCGLPMAAAIPQFNYSSIPQLHMVFSIFSFAMGACIASFLNVVIWRFPRGESIVSPPSHCPKCNAPIRWWQNIPVISWLALRGRCSKCKEPISPRYIMVEALGGLLFLAAYLHYEQFAPIAWIWISLMIIGSFIDFDLQLLPDFVTVGGMIFGVLLSAVFWCLVNFVSPECGLTPLAIHPIYSISGLAFGFGLLWLVRYLGTKAFRREAMGMGDVLLMGAVGALFGPVAVLVTLMCSTVLGAIVGVALILLSKAKLGKFVAIPYGPYICMGCLIWMFRGPELVHWYISLLTRS